MNSAFLKDNFGFVVNSPEHFWSSSLFSLFFIICLVLSRRFYPQPKERILLVFMCALVFIAHPMMLAGRFLSGTFDYTEHLPLHLCNIMGFLLPIALYFKNQTLWSILYYWIMLGTIQSLVTPTLEHSFPHYEYWRYFIIHAGLVLLALYPIFVYGWRLKFYHAIRAALFMNLVALVVYFIDITIGANYMFMVGHPKGNTIYNLLGEWPIYFLNLEWFMLIGFTVLTLPFYDRSKAVTISQQPVG